MLSQELTTDDKFQMTPFHLACEEGNVQMVQALLVPLRKLGLSDPRKVHRLRKGTALFLAEQHGHNSVVQLLAAESPTKQQQIHTAETANRKQVWIT